MALSARVEKELRELVAAGDQEAQRAIGLWMAMQKQKNGTTGRRIARRAYERSALRATRAARARR